MVDMILNIVMYALLLIASFAVYFFVMSKVLPKQLLKTSYDVHKMLGRGLKKFTYPEGRAVLYEAQPDIRKYIERYVLFTYDGYKYIQLAIGAGVKNYVATIVMLDNKNRVIDAVSLAETTAGANRSRSVRLHDRTSYVAISLKSANDVRMNEPVFALLKLRDILIYYAGATLAAFLLIYAMYTSAMGIVSALELKISLSFNEILLVIPALLVALSSLGVLLLSRIKHGIKVVFR